MSTPAFVAALASSAAGSSTTSFQIPSVPAGTNLFAFIYSNPVPTSVTTVGGAAWSKVTLQSSGGIGTLWIKTADANDPSGYLSITGGSTGTIEVLIAGYSNAAVDAASNNNFNSGAGSYPTVTASSKVAQLVCVALGTSTSTSTSPSVDSRLTTRYTLNTGMYARVSDVTGGYTGAGTTPAYTDSATVARNMFTVGLYLANVAPNAPTLNLPSNTATIDRTVTQRFTWTFSDPNVGDTQSAFDLRYSADSGTTWTTASGTTPNTYLDVAGGTLSAGSYQWQVRTYDSQGVVGPWSASSFFTAATPPTGPTITDPTNGASLPASSYAVTFSYPSLTAYRYTVTDAGSGTVLIPTTTVTDSTSRTFTVTGLANGSTVNIALAVQSGGLWSADVVSTNPVSYSPPPTPTVWVGSDDTTATIEVDWATAAPVSPAPAAVTVDVYVSSDGGTTSERVAAGLPINGTWTYPWPASGVDYSFRVVAAASNGITAASRWVT